MFIAYFFVHIAFNLISSQLKNLDELKTWHGYFTENRKAIDTHDPGPVYCIDFTPPHPHSTFTSRPRIILACHIHPRMILMCHIHPRIILTCYIYPRIIFTCYLHPRIILTCYIRPRIILTCYIHPRIILTCYIHPRIILTCHIHPRIILFWLLI